MTTTAPPPLRLMLVYEEDGRYGTPTLARTLVGALADYVDVTVVAPDEETASWIAADRPGAATIATPPITGWRSGGALREYRRVLQRVRPDVLHLCLPTPRSGTRYLALLARTVRGVRSVGVENSYFGPGRPWSRVSTWAAVAALDAHVAVGENVGRIIEARWRLRRGSIRAIPNAIAPRPPHETRRLGPAPVVGVVSRLTHSKGHDVLVRALADRPETTLVVVGTGPDRDALQKLAHDLGRADSTHFLGFQDRPEDYLAGMDVFAMPSRTEAVGLVALEAMAAGLPVVASDVGSVREVVADGVTGLLVPPDDPAALAAALDRLLTDPALREQMGVAGKARVEAHFTPAQHARAYEVLYDELAPPTARAQRRATT